MGAGDSPAVLRLYRWAPPAVSVGWAQPLADRRDALERLRAQGYGAVRRPTGGGAVLHDVEVTYAVALPSFGLAAREACARIHVALRRGLERLGIGGLESAEPRAVGAAAEFARREGTAGADAGSIVEAGGGTAVAARGVRRAAPGACFAAASVFELTWRTRKLVGSAQRRLGGAFLQHGAVPLEAGQAPLAAVWPDAAGAAASVREAAGRWVLAEDLERALAAGVAQTFGVDLREDALTPAEEDRARRLAAARYGTDDFLYRI